MPSLGLGVSQSNLTSSTAVINGQGTEFMELEETQRIQTEYGLKERLQKMT